MQRLYAIRSIKMPFLHCIQNQMSPVMMYAYTMLPGANDLQVIYPPLRFLNLGYLEVNVVKVVIGASA